MANTVRIKALDGTPIEFTDEVFARGGMKDAYWGAGKKYVVLFFRDKQDAMAKERLMTICGVYRDRIFNSPGGEYWKNLFAWPEHVVEWNGKLGVTVPTYQSKFFFPSGKFKGKEKEGKWFATAKLRNKFIEPEHKGNWLTHFRMLIQIARAVKRLHAAGLAHSDLSYKNVLVDPSSGSACVIDCDGLVVPGRYPPDVVGTPDFIAPEVLSTRSLKLSDPARKLPNIQTDRHALAVMVYMYLLYRHPLRGGKVHDLDPATDEEISMGAKALFVEHPTDKSNRPKIDQLDKASLPDGDPEKIPYTVCGPYLKELFDKAFIKGLHNPAERPTAEDWMTALVKTTDLMQPCQNPNCTHKWFVFDNTRKPRCPFCGTEFHGQLPVLKFFISHKPGSFTPENYCLMVFDKQSLYPWHVNQYIFPNERMTDAEKKPVGDFHFLKGRWILVNRSLQGMRDVDEQKDIKPGEYVELLDGKKILLGRKGGDRLIYVQLVNN